MVETLWEAAVKSQGTFLGGWDRIRDIPSLRTLCEPVTLASLLPATMTHKTESHTAFPWPWKAQVTKAIGTYVEQEA